MKDRLIRLARTISLMATLLTTSAARAMDQSAAQQSSAQAASDAAVPPPALLTLTDAPEAAVPLPQARSFVAATVDTALLAASGPGARFGLQVAADRTLTMIVSRIERRYNGSHSVLATLEGIPNSVVVMVVRDDAVAADITCSSQSFHYRFKYAGNGVHLVCDVDDSAFPPCGGARPAPNRPKKAGVLDDNDGPAGPDGAPDGNPEGGCLCISPTTSVFDAMVVYTNLARAAAGGTSAIEAEVQLAVDMTNLAYENSSIAARYRLVWMTEVAYDEVGTYNDHLDRLTSSTSNPWLAVRQYRNIVNADFCTLWVNDGAYCGLAWCTSYADSAYSVVTWHCGAGNLSHPHEVGHNQGCDHDPDNGGGCGAYSYSFGHRFTGTDAIEYRTVMAYAPGVRIPYFSNPSVIYQGTATGTAQRNNRLTINNRRLICEGFEATRYDIWVDFAFAGSEAGTYPNPYNTMNEGLANIDPPGFNAWELPRLLIKCGTTSWTGTISSGMRIENGCAGLVRIGD